MPVERGSILRVSFTGRLSSLCRYPMRCLKGRSGVGEAMCEKVTIEVSAHEKNPQATNWNKRDWLDSDSCVCHFFRYGFLPSRFCAPYQDMPNIRRVISDSYEVPVGVSASAHHLHVVYGVVPTFVQLERTLD